MLSKPANSDTENGIKNSEMSPEKKIIYSGNWILKKTPFERYHNNTVEEWITSLLKNSVQLSLKK